jgi:precorrin-2 dehydrogenase/sirohydrochlorin ferrochelatase
MRYFPLFLDVLGKSILVVGGGEVASRKIEALLRAGAAITVVSPNISPYIQSLIDDGRCVWIPEKYTNSVLNTSWLQVWATTDNAELNHTVHRDAKALGILVNVVDDQPYCDFITPSMIERGRIQIAISSGGASPVLIRNLRKTLEMVLPQNLALLADFGSAKRDDIKLVFPSVDLRRRFWEQFLDDSRVKSANTKSELERVYQQYCQQDVVNCAEFSWIEMTNDVELLTMKAIQVMQQAELLLYPEGIDTAYLDLSRRDAERVCYDSIAGLIPYLEQAERQACRVCIFVSKSREFDIPLNACTRVISAGSLVRLTEGIQP